MRTTLLVGVAGVAAAIAAVTTAGTAAAAEPIVIPEAGFAGVWLTPGETAALANSPLPDMADGVISPAATRVSMAPGSTLANPDGSTYASNAAILGEAAAHPGGSAGVFLSNPADPADPGAILTIVQDW
ncbi:hypothetical protein AB0L82_09000 [Nocardia sp. NPDC052001]|uniref:hypothetical protein n=1 Tax=Nocardia sp. NPDC052001 TaxID=3154853 RepID=UPI0034383DAD